MNKTIEKFLVNNHVDVENATGDFSIKSHSDINPILDRYYIPGQRTKKEISIANILGYSYNCFGLSRNLIDNLDHFFDGEGTSYQTRSVGMMAMERDECVSKLKQISINDTVYVRECENNQYIITNNGMHRFHVLRFHYINELNNIDITDKTQVAKLKEKYTIPVECQETDYVKTYAYYILSKLHNGVKMSCEYDSDYEITGRVVIEYLDKKRVYTDGELLELLKYEIGKNIEKLSKHLNTFEYYMENLPTFKNFLEQNNINLFTQGVSI